MTLEELAEALESFRDRAAEAAPEVAMAMAGTYEDHLTRVTLRRTYSVPGQFGTPAPIGSPVSYRTGELARSVTRWPGASSGLSATAHVAPHTIYAAVQEHGQDIYARNFRYMHWINSGGGHYWPRHGGSAVWHEAGEWWKEHVYVPPRPYMLPALNETAADGSLVRSAALEFRLVTAGWQL